MSFVTSWSYCPIEYDTVLGCVEDITQRTYITNNISGNKVKLKFSNRFSKDDLILDKVVLGQRKEGQLKIEEQVLVTYKNEERICIKADEEFYSDEIAWTIQAGTEIVLSIYIKDKTEVQSSCSNWSTKCWRTRYGIHGDYTMEQSFDELMSKDVYPYVDADANKSDLVVGVAGIYIDTEESVKNITMFGDSITHMSYYSDALCKNIYEKYPGKVTVVNRGIGGNRLLNDSTYLERLVNHGKCFGIAGMKRYQEDLFSDNQPDAVLILIGVNDIMHPFQFDHRHQIVTADELAAGVTEIIEAVHSHGGKAYVGTVMPFKMGDMPWFDEAEPIRIQYNEWVRTQQTADGVMDFDQAIRAEQDIHSMKDGFHIGDGLHPNTAGGELMAELVPVEMIMEEA